MAESLAFAIGVAISPIPIAAMVLILGGERAPANGPLFALGWTVGVAISAAVFLVVVLASGVADDQPTWLALLELVFGAAFVLIAVRALTKPHRRVAEVPGWLSTVDAFSPAQAVGLGAALSGANPKNLALALGGSLALTEAGFSGADAVPALVAWTAVAAIGVLFPLAVYELLPRRSSGALEWVRRFVIRRDRSIIVVLGFVIGAAFLLEGARAL